MKNNTEKISEPKIPCLCQEHEPPRNQVFSPGTYKHTCPECGEVTVFEIPITTL